MHYLRDSGHVIVSLAADTKAILDVAPIGPDHQPGHAHADSLSFELSVGGNRLVVNSGTSTYVASAERQRQRSTAAHSTVEIDRANSSDVWKSFRVGRRARPFDVSVSHDDGGVTVSASHDGYGWLPGRPIHTRCWRFEPRRLVVTDTISGEYTEAVARFHLHPQVSVAGDRLRLPDGHTVTWRTSGGAPRIVGSSWHPEFGASMPGTCLELPVPRDGSRLELSW